ncbi:MAG: glycosyltransferase family 2 protein [Lachnospiraceae bacterium]|nr:glycosyltransferase family 2 protein [Candidatus Equihabitans merdae]
MVVNNGFLIKNDRFSMTDDTCYILRGWLAPRTELSASMDGKPFPLKVERVTENVDERYGGAETKVIFRIDEYVQNHKALKVYTTRDGEKRLCFAISVKDLMEKQEPVKVFIDDYSVNTKDGYFRLQGWAAGHEDVTVSVATTDGKTPEGKVEKYTRLDVVDLFDEYPVGENCGFHIELRPVPDLPVVVTFRSGEDVITRTYKTSASAVKMQNYGRLMKKGTEYLRYKGPKALAKKTYDKLFNPVYKPIIYTDWIKKHLPSDRELARQKAESFEMNTRFSIVVPLYKTPEEFLVQLVDSVKAQSYGNWELVLSDGSGENSPLDGILTKLEESDARIKVLRNKKQLHIAENTNAAIAAATGDFIVFADHDDLLTPNALFENAAVIRRHPDAEMIYSDEDKIGVGEKYMQPNLKPDYDPDLLCSVNYICHLLAVKKDLLNRVGLLRPAFDGAQDYDFVLRCTEETKAIYHIPKILYHWRFFDGSTAANPESKTYAFEAGKRAIEAHYERLGLPGKVEMGPFPGIYRTTWHYEDDPMVSILIPNKDHTEDLDVCLKSIDRGRVYPNLEIIIIENNSTEPETFAYYEELKKRDERVKVITYDEGVFNFSAINNLGAKEAKGDYLFLLNNDTEFISEDVIGEMVDYCRRDDVGAVGALLYYNDNTIQHAGVIVGWGGVAGHAFVNQKRGETGYMHRIICQQDYSAVTAACMMVKRSVFEEIGGFSEELAVAFNDIDLCMKIREAGYLIVYDPYCELYHYESKSRGLDQGNPEKVRRFQKEMAIFQKKWPEILRDGDPYYNPNFSMITQDFSLKHN